MVVDGQQSNIPAVPGTTATAADTFWATNEPRHAPPRLESEASWFVDGKDVFENLATELAKARKTIWLTGWMLTLRTRLIRNTGPQAHTLRERITNRRETSNGGHDAASASREASDASDELLGYFGDISDTTLLFHLLDAAINRKVEVRVLVWSDPAGYLKTGNGAAVHDLKLANAAIRRMTRGAGGSIEAHLCTPNVIGLDPWNAAWAYHQKSLVIDQDVAYIGGIDLARGRWDTPDHDIDGGRPEFAGDFYNGALSEADQDATRSPRLPWHDIHLRLRGEAAGDVGRNFLQRWHKQTHWLPLLVGSEDWQRIDPLPAEATAWKGKQMVQVVRSISASTGAPARDGIEGFMNTALETSIREVYEKAIRNAKQFIYIENQFFISQNAWCPAVDNPLSKALIDRVWAAIEEDLVHRVDPSFFAAIVIPVMPDAEDGMVRQGQLYQEYTTVAHLLGVLRARLARLDAMAGRAPASESDIDAVVRKYIGFFSLYRWGKVGGKLAHGQIYPHVKAMIVDDRVAIIGSANIFDRSLNGDRDAEIAAVVIDGEEVPGRFAGAGVISRAFALSLRKRLWAEHLGVAESEVEDALRIYQDIWLGRASTNTRMFEEAFADMPRINGYVYRRSSLEEWRKLDDLNMPPGFRAIRPSSPDDKDALRQQAYDVEDTAFVVPNDVTVKRSRATPLVSKLSGLAEVKGHLIRFPLWGAPSRYPAGPLGEVLSRNEASDEGSARA
jgi:phosphatidylserine/phosphatidylglycerophosphate/cardiolipin synthase-like enzyme